MSIPMKTAPLALLTVLLVRAGCGSDSRDNSPAAEAKPRVPGSQYGGHLRVGYAIEPTSLDAVLGRSGGDAYYWRQIFDQLVDADPGLEPRPETSLATRWEIAYDPDSITFYLREGVVFHDGTTFNAEAVKINVERILDPATKATPRASMTVIESVDVVAEHVVRFNLKGPWGAGLNMLADRGGVMNSPAMIEQLGPDYGWMPSGTGPFKVNKVITGTSVHLVRNEHYWGRDADGNRLPFLDEVTIRVIRDETVLASALRTGEIDLAYLPYKEVASFSRDDRFAIEKMDGGSIALVLTFNVDFPPLDNVDVRRAIVHAIRPDVINRAIFFNKVIEADSGMWPLGAWAHAPDVQRPTYAPDKAREFLRRSGVQDVEFTAVTNNSPVLVPTAEIVRAMLKDIGITMNIDVLNTGAATESFFHGQKYGLYVTSWSRYPEPDWVASLAYKSDGYYNAGNVLRPDIDEMVQLGASLYGIDDRRRVYHELNALVLDEAWFVPMLYGVTHAAAPARVRNLDTLIGWDGKMNLRQIWLEQ